MNTKTTTEITRELQAIRVRARRLRLEKKIAELREAETRILSANAKEVQRATAK